jgi:hypothetical protein
VSNVETQFVGSDISTSPERQRVRFESLFVLNITALYHPGLGAPSPVPTLCIKEAFINSALPAPSFCTTPFVCQFCLAVILAGTICPAST